MILLTQINGQTLALDTAYMISASRIIIPRALRVKEEPFTLIILCEQTEIQVVETPEKILQLIKEQK